MAAKVAAQEIIKKHMALVHQLVCVYTLQPVAVIVLSTVVTVKATPATILVHLISLAADLLEVSCLPAVVEVLVYKINTFKLVIMTLADQWLAAGAA